MSQTPNQPTMSSGQQPGPRRLMTRRRLCTVDADGKVVPVTAGPNQQRVPLQPIQRAPLGAHHHQHQQPQRMIHQNPVHHQFDGRFSGNSPMSPPGAPMHQTPPSYQRGHPGHMVHGVDQLIQRQQNDAVFRMYQNQNLQKRPMPPSANYANQPQMKRTRQFPRNQTYPNVPQQQFHYPPAPYQHLPPNHPGFRQPPQYYTPITRFVRAHEAMQETARSAQPQVRKQVSKATSKPETPKNEENPKCDSDVVSRENDRKFLSEFFIIEEGSTLEKLLKTAIYP